MQYNAQKSKESQSPPLLQDPVHLFPNVSTSVRIFGPAEVEHTTMQWGPYLHKVTSQPDA